MAESFGAVLVLDRLKNRISRLVDLALQSASYENLNELSARDENAVPLDALSQMDVFLSSGQSGEIQEQILRFRKEIPEGKLSEILDSLESNPSLQQKLRRANRDTRLGRLAAYVAASLPGTPSYESLLKVLGSYNGRIDKFLEADAFRQERSLLRGETPAKNDFIDASHLLYLEKDSQIMVTADRFLYSICAELFPTNCCSVEDFRRQYGWT